MDNTIKKKLSVFRKRQTVFVIIYGLINAAVIAGIIAYYRLKEQALAGALYLEDNAYGEAFVRKMFSSGITDNNIRAGRTAMESAGYGSHGFSYMSRLNGEMYVLIAIIVVLLIALGSGLYNCYRLGHKGFVKKVCDVYADNERLSKQLENEQIYNKEQYQKMQDFIENIAHQIKTPLSVITMKLEMIQELCGINEDICRLITDCTKNTFKIKMFIKKLLDISRIESGKITLSSDEIVIDYIVEESVECSVDDKQKVSVNYGNEDRHRKMYADEGWLLEALINVISNCYEHINQKKGGMVYIDISSNSEVCMITISDNGDGIQDCDVAGIFDRFMSRKSQDEFHAGIGLNLSKLIIEAHHGNIRAGNSDKYGGAQFKIILPLYKFKGKL